MLILGISCYYHDSAACLIKGKKIIAAAEEERFTRKKHETSFPENAIRFCLKYGKTKPSELDCVAYYEKPLLKLERLLMQHIKCFPKSYFAFYKAMPSWITEKLRIQKKIRSCLKGYKGNIFFASHHMSHAASFFLSGFKKSAILTIDGVGEYKTATLGIGENNNIRLIKGIDFPDSLGLLYSAVTAFLGFRANNGEGKVMGLAAYGNPDKYYNAFKKLIKINKDSSFSLNMEYFSFEYKMRMFSRKIRLLLGRPRSKKQRLEKRHMDIAASLQKITEDAVFGILGHLRKITKSENLCYSGGLALNCALNGKILKKTGFKKIFILPAPGDSGSAIGAAALCSVELGGKRPVFETAYLGPEYSKEEIKNSLKKYNLAYKEIDDNKLIKKTARLIYKNKIIAWFNKRMEFGPRALGNRSILANPCNPNMKSIINSRVKFRESFRPFAPVICYESLKEYFLGGHESRYMLHVFKVRPEKAEKIPAVCHVDNTGRVQTIRESQNPRYYRLIKEFQKLSGVPVLLNTSFNVRGEPIVCNPEDAVKCFLRTNIDYLVFEGIIAKK